jgi:SAM-dependent methyltransferase
VDEICGDGRLSFSRRVAYLCANAARNLLVSGARPQIEPFYSGALKQTPSTASPSRVMTEAFLQYRLPDFLPRGPIRVLEIGCGSGRLCRFLAELGYTGEYLGIDIHDRFDRESVSGFRTDFWLGDAHDFSPDDQRFDLIVSVSALEHIPHDTLLINKFPRWLLPNGVELHFLPSGWGLFAYLWHGWRQYPVQRIGEKFGSEAIACALGGLASTLLHLCFITIGEMLLPFRARTRWPRLYSSLLGKCLVVDKFLPSVPTMYAVRRAVQ